MIHLTMAVMLLVFTSVRASADTLAITARQAVVRTGRDRTQAILTTAPRGMTFALLETRPH